MSYLKIKNWIVVINIIVSFVILFSVFPLLTAKEQVPVPIINKISFNNIEYMFDASTKAFLLNKFRNI